MAAYYNEFDPKAAAWLRELIKAGHIAPGDVDERSIEDVRPDDLRRYTQCHFFAGIGVWSYALRRAGWPDDRPVWTGSCPCQPFSAAGKGDGFADERHLWPHFHWLIQNSRPAVVFGEQVASKDGLGWLDLVQADLEGSGYASGAVDTCAAGFGAPHIRQRMYWVAYAHSGGSLGGVELRKSDYGFNGGAIDGMVNGVGEGLEGHRRGLEAEGRREGEVRPVAEAGEPCGVADASNGSRQRCEPRTIERGLSESVEENAALRTGPANGHWSDADWLHCRDGKWRPVEPGTFPLAHGAAARVGRLRGYGNAINAEQAQAFIEAYVECFRLSQSYELTTDKGVFG